MPEDSVKLVPAPTECRNAKWSQRLVVCSLILFFCPCLLPLLRESFMGVSGMHVHPYSELFSAVLFGCVATGVLINAVAVVFGVWALSEIRSSDGRLVGGGRAKSGIAGALILLVFVALATPGVLAAREAARITQCKCNMKQMGLAFHNYHDAHKAYPPDAICDADGTSLLS